MLSEPIPALLTALIASLILTPAVVLLAKSSGLIDVPNARSSHQNVVPRGGGLAVIAAAAATSVASTDGEREVVVLLAGVAVLAFTGLLDDRFGLPAIPRLAIQLIVPLGAVLLTADASGGSLLAVTVASVVWCAGYVNAFNFMDGINGIAASQAAIAGAFLALVARGVEDVSVELTALALTGAALGFLPFNAFRPKIFLGDVGSYGIGFWLAGTALLLWKAEVSPIVLLGPFMMYIADTSTVLIRRWRRGDAIFEAHREHAYQRLQQAGWSHGAVTSLCAAITASTSGLMLLALDRRIVWQLACAGVAVTVVIGYLRFVQRHSRIGSASS